MQFLLYGEDSQRSKKQLDKFVAEFKARRDPQGYNTVILEGENILFEDITGHYTTSPFLGEKRLVVIKNISKNKDISVQENLCAVFETNQLPDYAVMVFWEEGIFEKKPPILMEFLIKEKYTQCFDPLTSAQGIEWVRGRAKQDGVEMDQSAATRIVEISGGNLASLELETGKIIAWARSENKNNITARDLQTIIPSPLDEEIFHFIDALFQGKIKDAFQLLYAQWSIGSSSQEIFGAIAWQVRTLLEIKDFTDRNRHASSADIAREVGVHPFVVKKTSLLLQRVRMESLCVLHSYLLKVDKDIKTGKRSVALVFDQLVVDLAGLIK